MSFWITADGVKVVGPHDTADSAAGTLKNILRPTDAVQYAIPRNGYSIIRAAGAEPIYRIEEFA